MIEILPADGPEDIATAGGLFKRYADWLAEDHGISLAFQNFEAELAGLPGKYAPPAGAMLLARDGAGRAVGCVALRPFDDTRCEIKRLYVTPEARGTGLGRALAVAILEAARAAGYERALLDTAPFMQAAQGLYQDLGFREVEAYYDNPYPGCVFLEAALRPADATPLTAV